MAWSVKIDLDADKPATGTTTATWNKGQDDEFSYSRRIEMNETDGYAFVAETKAAKVAHVQKKAAEATLAGNAEAWFNE